jgi:hypothetical protein
MKIAVLVVFLSLLLLIGLFLTANANAASPLALTVTTDKPYYRLNSGALPSTINLGGNLTLNGYPVSGGLVAVTVLQGTIGHYIRQVLFKTLATGSLPQQNWSLNVSIGVLGLRGAEYVPQTVFICPSSQTNSGPAFNVTYKNTGSSSLLKLYLTLTIFDAANVPITTINVTQSDQSIPPGSTTSIIIPPTDLHNWVTLGNATVCASAFDNIPPYWYFPYCPEASARFTIVSSGGGQTYSQAKQTSFPIKGNYNLGFNLSYVQALPLYHPWGNYTIQVSSNYQGQQAINSHTFWTRIPGDVNGDGKVDISDLNPVAFWWGKTVPPAPAYADLNGDGKVDISDINPIAFYWGKTQ